MPDIKPDHLIIRYLSNEASAIDQEYLFDWVSRSNENKRVFDAYVTVWSKQANGHHEFEAQPAMKKLNERINAYESSEKVKTIFWNRWNIAAAIILLIAAAFTLYRTGIDAYKADTKSLLTEFVTSSSPNAVTLSDGSHVTLNINSTLEYPEAFTGNSREVYLTGEGFFEIGKDSLKPFFIHAGNLTTRVVGTSFNINTAATGTVVSVATGSVRVYDGTQEMLLKPYEKVTYSQNTFTKESTDLSELAWHSRTLKFDDTPLDEVIKKLQQHYEVNIELKNDALKKCALTGTFTNETLETVLQAIEYSLDIVAAKKNDLITLSGKGCQ